MPHGIRGCENQQGLKSENHISQNGRTWNETRGEGLPRLKRACPRLKHANLRCPTNSRGFGQASRLSLRLNTPRQRLIEAPPELEVVEGVDNAVPIEIEARLVAAA